MFFLILFPPALLLFFFKLIILVSQWGTFCCWGGLTSTINPPLFYLTPFVTRLVYAAGKALLFRHSCSHRAWRKIPFYLNVLILILECLFLESCFHRGLSSTTLFFWICPGPGGEVACALMEGGGREGVLRLLLVRFSPPLHHCKPTSPPAKRLR